jgi:hypothetical protein
MNDPHADEERRVRRVSKGEGPIVASWFETAQERLLTMRGNDDVGAPAPKKKARVRRALKRSTKPKIDQAVLL